MYFSGLEKEKTISLLSKVPGAAGMMSFLEYSPNLLAACEASNLRLAMDSGAYSKQLQRKDIERYAATIVSLGARCDFYANADVIGDQRQSNENYRFLLSLLPAELHSLVLWVYQNSAPIRDLDEGLERFQRVGVGGLVALSEARRSAVLGIVAQRIVEAGCEAHYYGLGQCQHLRRLAKLHQSKFSTDATTWLVGVKYARLIHRDGYQVDGCKTGFDWTPEEMSVQNARVMQKWVQPPPTPRPPMCPEFQMFLFE